jgi:hypothetical protein
MVFGPGNSFLQLRDIASHIRNTRFIACHSSAGEIEDKNILNTFFLHIVLSAGVITAYFIL